MSFGYPGLFERKYTEFEKEAAERELINFWLRLTKYEKQALRTILVTEGRKLALKDKQKEIEELQDKILKESRR